MTLQLFRLTFFFLISVIVATINGDVTTSKKLGAESRIIGGQPATATQFKFAAAIYVQTNDSKFFCGGTLTSNQHVITSATCTQNAVLFTIQVGSNHLEGDSDYRVTVATSTYYIHPDFDPETLDANIAVIEFREPIWMNGNILHIYTSPNNYLEPTSSIALGFGQTSDSDSELSNELMYIEVTTITNDECKIYYGNQIIDNMLCVVGNYNEGTCTGDSGGPLVVRSGKYFFLIGVSSFISGRGCEGTDPSGYTRVYPYRDWIHAVTGRYNQTTY